MSKLPESIKTVQAYTGTSGTIVGKKFGIILGKNEVMVLRALFYWWYGIPGAGQPCMHMGLWRKSETLPAAVPLIDSTDLIWGLSDMHTFVTESLRSGGKGYIQFPAPFILIRAPQLVARSATITSSTVQMRLYYQLRKVSDKDMAELMMKDHA